MRRYVAAVLMPLLLAACSPVDLLNATAPRAGVVTATDIAYASGAGHELDIYAPARPAGKAPVVVFFYGGGWQDGSRGMYRFAGTALARNGIVAVIPDYRHYPQARFPGFVEDGAKAVAWTRAHARRYGGDPGRLFLMGHSAGAQIATLIALDGHYLRAAGVDPHAIAGVIGLSGPYDFLPLRSATLKAIFGPESAWPRSQPINFVTPGAPPALLAAGTADHTVDPGNTTRLAARLRQAGDEVEEHLYPGIGHELMIGAFAWPLAFTVPIRRDVLRFIAAHRPAGSPR